MSHPPDSRLRGMSLPDLVAALVAFRAARGVTCARFDQMKAQGQELLDMARAWRELYLAYKGVETC